MDRKVYFLILLLLLRRDRNPTLPQNDLVQRLGKNRRRRSVVLSLLQRSYDAHSRPSKYSEQWIDMYLDSDFFSLFRMTRNSFSILLTLMITQGEFRVDWVHGKEPVAPEKNLQIGLKYLSSKEGLRELSDQFNVAISTVSIIRERTVHALLRLVPLLIKWPEGNDIHVVVDDFEQLCGFPGVMGAIDGSHIPIKVPKKSQESFQNRKMGHSIVLQAVCTRKKLFTDVFIGAAGRTHDARVLTLSPLLKCIQAYGVQSYFPNENLHILGDSAYPLKSWMLVPYKDYGRLSREQSNYNNLHSRTRFVIENAFALLKNRWQKCGYINVYNVQTAAEIVGACCVLHNFCLLHDDYFDMEYPEPREVHGAVRVDQDERSGVDKRNRIAAALYA